MITFMTTHIPSDGDISATFHETWRDAVIAAARLVREHEPEWTLAMLSHQFQRGRFVEFGDAERVIIEQLEVDTLH